MTILSLNLRSPLVRFLTVCMALVMAGCAGTPLEGVPPTIVDRTPLPSAEGVGVAEPIRVEFSEPLRASSVNNSTVLLTDSNGNNIVTDLTLANDGRSLSVKLTAPVSVPNTLTLKLAGPTDLAGNPLAEEAWSWKLPAWLSAPHDLKQKDFNLSPNRYIAFHSTKLDRQGNPFVLVEEQDSLGRFVNLQVVHWTGSTWESLGKVVSSDQTSSVSIPKLAVVQNRPVVAWIRSEFRPSDYQRLHIKRWTGSEWEELLTTENIYDSYQLLYDSRDGFYLRIWYRGGTENSIEHWSPSGRESIPTTPFSMEGFDLLLGSDGELIAHLQWGSQFRWTGTAWEKFGERFGGWAERAVVFAGREQGFVAARGGREPDANCGSWVKMYAYRFDASSVVNLKLPSPAKFSYLPFIMVDRFEHPLVFWKGQTIGPCESQLGSWLHLQGWNGSGWDGLNVPAADPVSSRPQNIEVDASGYPVLAWDSGNILSFARLNR